jgi:hypothetical protein
MNDLDDYEIRWIGLVNLCVRGFGCGGREDIGGLEDANYESGCRDAGYERGDGEALGER